MTEVKDNKQSEARVELTCFHDLFREREYDDDFGYHPAWNAEYDRWLRTVQKLDPDFYETNKNRVENEPHRDAYLAECFVIYYFQNVKHAQISELHPDGRGEKELDFACQENDEQYYVEVKSPGWRGEVWRRSGQSRKKRKQRKKQPKYLHAEVYPTSIKQCLREPIKKSLDQFREHTNNILAIPYRTLNPILEWHDEFVTNQVQELTNSLDPRNVLDEVIILKSINAEGESITYRSLEI